MNGILIIDKPDGITSHDVVARCRRILKTKRIGHTGTLDPFATGVVVILVGKATRLAQFLDKDSKAYEAIVRFGFETTTGDLTGEVRPETVAEAGFEVSREEIEKVLPEFRGEQMQTPPMYSAKKVEGKKLYELARQGIEIERKAVKITIHELALAAPRSALAAHEFALRVVCSAGTYIRVLAEDLGKKIGTGAHLAALRRTGAGKFGLEKAVTLEKLEAIAAAGELDEILISMNEAVSHLAEVRLSAEEKSRILNGMRLRAELPEAKNDDFLRLTEGAELVAIGIYREPEKTVQPRLVLV
jgi:tRNA pseudouridine55 synthase